MKSDLYTPARRCVVVTAALLLAGLPAARAQLSIGIGLPGVRIGIDLPWLPELRLVPGYPVYYAPGVASNYFFYDGRYWVYAQDGWYASRWYNGPWDSVDPEGVPLYVLRVPVRYYRDPPTYFRGWRPEAPPRWGDHWGPSWQARRRGWDRWDRNAAPRPEPLPAWQRQYPRERYPQADQQRELEERQGGPGRRRDGPQRPVAPQDTPHRPRDQPPAMQRPTPGRDRETPAPDRGRPETGRGQAPAREPERGGYRGDLGARGERGDRGEDRGPDRKR